MFHFSKPKIAFGTVLFLLFGLTLAGAGLSRAGLVVEGTHTYRLSPGWNMVSMPFEGVDLTISDVRKECGQSAQMFFRWNNQTNSYPSPVDRMSPGYGYWVRVYQPCEIKISGRPWSGSVSLNGAGWHMIGAPGGGVDLGAISHNCEIAASVWSWDPTATTDIKYSRATHLRQGAGYWFRVSGSCTLNF